jgi:hypothetical protein
MRTIFNQTKGATVMNKFLTETEVMSRLSNLRSDHERPSGPTAMPALYDGSAPPSLLVAREWQPRAPVQEPLTNKGLFWRGLARASSGMTLLIPGLAAAGALVLQSGLLGATAALSYVVGVGTNLCRKRLWETLLIEQRREPPPLPHESDMVDETARRLLGRLHLSRLGRSELHLRSNARQQNQLDQLAESIVDLERLAVDAVLALDRMGRFLLAHDRRQVAVDRERLERLAEISAPALRAELQAAARVAGEGLRRHDDILAAQALLEAQLDTLVRTLELIPAWLVQMETRETTATLDLRRSLRPALEAEMRLAEESLNTALAQEAAEGRVQA